MVFFWGGGLSCILPKGGGVQAASFWSRVEKLWEVVTRSGEIGMRR